MMNARVAPESVEMPRRRRGRVPKFTVDMIKPLVDRRLTQDQMVAELKCSLGTVVRLKQKLRGEVSRAVPGRRAQQRKQTRMPPESLLGKSATMPPIDNPALTEGRPLYPNLVRPVAGLNSALVDGVNSRKIGREITKGRWTGFPIYTLTLPERTTCPTSCALWRSCYGNHANFAIRIEPGPALEARLGVELALLQSRHPKGFAVRLHVLGDFYSIEYVRLWAVFLESFPALHVFGFTARTDARRDPIARELVSLALHYWPADQSRPMRFALRFSNAPVDECSTVVIEHPLQKPDDAIVCPQQLGSTDTCGQCGLCWNSRKRIAFIRH